MGDQHADSYIKGQLHANELQGYTSVYRSVELNKDLVIEFENEKLVVSFFGQKMPLDIIIKDEFTAMGMFKFKFVRDSANNILSFRMDAPRAGNIQFERISFNN
ncbi:MAG: hypothetical protein ACI9FN_002699 [Saprospiraceae bacterium]|jgi:hypothetical protein